jgi:EmrB/QacA subfamily drug resistance transporter
MAKIKGQSAQNSRAGEGNYSGEEYSSLPRREIVLTMGGVMLALFLASLDQTVVSTAMPQIVADLHGFSRYTWVTTAYLVASTTVVPIAGRLSDMYGRKWFYVAGIIVFLVGSVLAATSQTMTQLILFRAVQGLGGGIMLANAFIAIGDLFPPQERGKYQGLLSGVFGVSSVIGPTLGGFITDSLSWHWIFFINLPLGIPAIGLFIAFFPNTRPSVRGRHIDYLGLCTMVLAVVPILLALSWAGVDYPWNSPQIIGALVFGTAMAGLFVVIEGLVPDPIIPLEMFRNRVVSISILATFLTGFGMFGAIIFIPLFFQVVLGASATSSGSFLTPMMLGVVAGTIIGGQAVSRLNGQYRLVGLSGLSLMGLGMFLLSRMTVQTPFGEAVAYIVVMGLGLGVTFPLYTIAVQNTVSRQMMGVATSSLQFFRTIGGTLGLAILGSVLNNRFAAQLVDTVPQGVKEVLSPQVLPGLARNPQALINPAAGDQLRAAFRSVETGGELLFQQLLQALRYSLASAITEVFLIGLLAVIVAWLVTILMKEAPAYNHQATAESGQTKRVGEATGDD